MSPRLATDRPRSSYLGATDIAAIAGVSPYRTPFEVYLEKIGELDPEARKSAGDQARQERGHRFEDVALDWYSDIEGLRIERVRRDVQHPRLPFVIVHPDARVVPWKATRRLIEVKTRNRPWDALPQHVEAQVQAQMAATDADAATVILQTFDGPPYPYDVPRNDELIGALEELASAFWQRVERRDPPPMDPSAAANRYLDRLWQDGPPMVADPDQRALLAALLDVRAEVARLEAQDKNLVIALKQSMHGAARLTAAGVGRVLWTAPSERRTPQWKAIAERYRALLEAQVDGAAWVALDPDMQSVARRLTPAALDAIVAELTSVEEVVRQFRPTAWKSSEETAA